MSSLCDSTSSSSLRGFLDPLSYELGKDSEFERRYQANLKDENALRQRLADFETLAPLEGLIEITNPEALRKQHLRGKDGVWKANLYSPQLLSLEIPSAPPAGKVNSRLRKAVKLLDELPSALGSCVVMAGGAALDMITHAERTNDVDLFIVSSQPRKVLRKVLALWEPRVQSVMRTKNAVSVLVDVSVQQTPQIQLDRIRKISEQEITPKQQMALIRHLLDEQHQPQYMQFQFILRSYSHPTQVVLGFDLDCCRCLYYQSKLYLTSSCLLALQYNTNRLEAQFLSVTYNGRLFKYARKGFMAWIPVSLGKVKAKHLKAASVPVLRFREAWTHHDSLVGLLALFQQGTVVMPDESRGSTAYCPVDPNSQPDYNRHGVDYYLKDNQVLGYRFQPSQYCLKSSLMKTPEAFVTTEPGQIWRIPPWLGFPPATFRPSCVGSFNQRKYSPEEWLKWE